MLIYTEMNLIVTESEAMSIKDVAKIAGVSPSTVSRIVNSGDVSAASIETQQRIWDAVRSSSYIPNQHARNLRRPREDARPVNRDIDCVYARIAGPHIDPFFTTLMHAAEVEALGYGYTLRYYYSVADMHTGNMPPMNAKADSAIVLGRADQEALKRLRGFYKHLVCSGLNVLTDEVDQVYSSGYDAAVNCVEYLCSLGHTRICYMGETHDEQRYSGYLSAMRARGIECPESLVVETPFTPTGGYDAVHELLQRKQPFTAIFCANDMSAVGALKALKEHKFHVPRDVSIVGINDMETVRYLDPMLTTVHIPLDEMGKAVAKLLIDRIEGGHKLAQKVSIPNQLIYRESCAAVRSSEK